MNEVGCGCGIMDNYWIWIIVIFFLLCNNNCGGGCGIFDNFKNIFQGDCYNWIWIVVIFFLFCGQKDYGCC